VSVITENAASRKVISRSKRIRSMRAEVRAAPPRGSPTASHNTWPTTSASKAPYRCSHCDSQTIRHDADQRSQHLDKGQPRTSMKPLITASM
jgi:hypothetical protein